MDWPIVGASAAETVTTIEEVALALREVSSLLRKRVAIGVMPEAMQKTSGKSLCRVSLSGRVKRGTLWIAMSTSVGVERKVRKGF